VLILQHPRERRVAIGTGRMTHLALPNSELHAGIVFEEHARVRALAAEGALLFPGGAARAPHELRDEHPRVLVVLDGTWSQARSLYRLNPFLHELPRIGFTPPTPSGYRIRREPRPDCWSTIEAVAHTLGELEANRARFAPLLGPFHDLVAMQLAHGATASNAEPVAL
jgi:DTW domain-containing protein YfiP